MSSPNAADEAMNPANTAILLIGFQNDIFLDGGLLRVFIENADKATDWRRSDCSGVPLKSGPATSDS